MTQTVFSIEYLQLGACKMPLYTLHSAMHVATRKYICIYIIYSSIYLIEWLQKLYANSHAK